MRASTRLVAGLSPIRDGPARSVERICVVGLAELANSSTRYNIYADVDVRKNMPDLFERRVRHGRGERHAGVKAAYQTETDGVVKLSAAFVAEKYRGGQTWPPIGCHPLRCSSDGAVHVKRARAGLGQGASDTAASMWGAREVRGVCEGDARGV